MRNLIGHKAALFSAVLALALVYTGQGLARSSHSVAVGDNYFSPRTLHITRGTTVSWRWRGRNSHNVVFRSRALHAQSRILIRGSYKLRFNARGNFHYVCTIHSQMTGNIVVR